MKIVFTSLDFQKNRLRRAVSNKTCMYGLCASPAKKIHLFRHEYWVLVMTIIQTCSNCHDYCRHDYCQMVRGNYAGRLHAAAPAYPGCSGIPSS